MEHIIQFAVGIDDNAICDRVMENAEKEIIKSIMTDCKDHIYAKNSYHGYKNEPSIYFKGKITEFMDEHKDEIISLAAKHLAERLAKTKAAKELTK